MLGILLPFGRSAAPSGYVNFFASEQSKTGNSMFVERRPLFENVKPVELVPKPDKYHQTFIFDV
jgi:hypothetical protein